MEKWKVLTLCISLISFLSLPAFGWIKVYRKDGTICIVGEGEKRFKKPELKTVDYIKKQARHYAKMYGIPENLFLNLIEAESNFNPKAVSSKGAEGLCQLMPNTAKALEVRDVFNVDENLKAGASYLSTLYRKYRDWKLALAAYNAGSTAVDRYGAVPPYRETQNYVRKVLNDRKFQRRRSKPKYKIVMKRVGNTVIISQQYVE